MLLADINFTNDTKTKCYVGKDKIINYFAKKIANIYHTMHVQRFGHQLHFISN